MKDIKTKQPGWAREEDFYGPFTKLGVMDPNHGKEITFLTGKFKGKDGLYLEKLDVQHRVVVLAGPGETVDRVRSMWEHTFKIRGFDGEFYSFEQAETDRVVAMNNRRRAAGLLPVGESLERRSRAVSPDPEEQLVQQIRQAMSELGISGPLPDRVVKKVNRRRG